jgi:cobalt-zinc-cadmium efflux system outer membrane protein
VETQRFRFGVWLVCFLVSAELALPGLADEPTHGQTAPHPSASEAQTAPAALRVADLEQIALKHNPTLAQATAQLDAARGREVQAGLYPNPTVGYNGEQIGLRGKAWPGEQQGLFIDQTIVTAGKLRLSRARFAQETAQASYQAEAQQYRVLNSVRLRAYQLAAMLRLLKVRAELLTLAHDAYTTTDELANVGASNNGDLLQARIEARQEEVALANATALYHAAWQQLAALIGEPCLPLTPLQDDLDTHPAMPDWDNTLRHLLENSPEMKIAQAGVSRAQFALRREQVEPIPNVQVRASSGYDFEADGRKVTTTVNVGVRLPIFDKNQGNIRAAEAELMRAQAEQARVELSLCQRLAREYARYQTALATVKLYQPKDPKFREKEYDCRDTPSALGKKDERSSLEDAWIAYHCYRKDFKGRKAAWPQVLVAQRTYFQLSVDYVQALDDLRREEVTILGLLLVDGMEEPPAPGEGGRQRQQGGQP